MAARATEEALGAPVVTVQTSIGQFSVELYYKHAPKTCRNFIELSRKGYYNGIIVSPAGGEAEGECQL